MKIFSILLLFCLGFASCKKYVDIKKSSAQSFLETANDCQLLLDNYDLFNTNYPYDGELSADDYYLDDAGYNLDRVTIEARTFYTWQSNAIRTSADEWVGPYNKIYHANLILETLATLSGTDINNLKGSALFMRAYALWNLAQLYIKPYSTATEQDPGLPIHLKSDINDVPGRGTIKDTYNRIIADLQEAATLLNITSAISSRPNKAAAYAMLARVYLSMGDYPNALTSANDALQLQKNLLDYNTIDTNTLTPFVRFNKEVIFQSVKGKEDALDPGYGEGNSAIIVPELINEYADNDLRKALFFKENVSDVDYTTPLGTYRFTGNYEPSVSSAQFNGLAVDELYLIRAEGYARTNNAAAAIADINTLLRSRWTTGTYTDKTTTDTSAALAIVLTERRKELVMRGLRWTDLRRLKDKTLTRTVNGTTYTLLPADNRYTLLIPQEVITNSKLAQNVR
ncbi:SusD family protein [Chitinophaga sp. CF118]|uniref:RagB/SusD family nutrient uptake outer membrane protein n=1 Tax=Chitinophaga sp. CF118 TaxID=1884367 RepID=UPI0008F2E80A|nr:RagB/SusD family nutrient uptake outer membrane protein [Chitinophaga sp. CF118]SFE35142.1 SusD family protein [Chitinophaga sp. CF118]